jgi:2-amino-4-hydroxy-6-hydroxymethyldihydropteridine diphosphokinase
MQPMSLTYLSLGSNLGDRAANLRRAISLLQGLGDVERVSSAYETEPVEVIGQAWFLNCAIALETKASPEGLLASVLAIEREMGRVRSGAKGPRVIDLDILLFGNEVCDSPDLNIPHPAMQERRFVLAPMAEIAPEARHPLFKRSMLELLEALPPQGQIVRKVMGSLTATD